jgi:hypothetical protein
MDVLGNAKVLKQAEFLVDRTDAQLVGVQRRQGRKHLAGEVHFTRVACDEPVQNVLKRGFAGAGRADQHEGSLAKARRSHPWRGGTNATLNGHRCQAGALAVGSATRHDQQSDQVPRAVSLAANLFSRTCFARCKLGSN